MPFVAPAEEIWEKRGMEKGEGATLLRQIERKFGPETKVLYRERVEKASLEELELWLDRFATAANVDEIFADG